MKRRTKIVCTLGPAVNSREQIKALIDAGMNVARLNCSHGDWETRRQWLTWIRELSPELCPIGILVDLQGPKFRIGDLAQGGRTLRSGEIVSLARSDADIPVPQEDMIAAIDPGSRILLGDGEVELKVTKETEGVFEAKVVSGGLVKSRQGMTLVGRTFETPAMTDKDREDARIACELGVDFIALSYVRRGADFDELRAITQRLDPQVRLCAKIETALALKNLDELLGACDMAMVARGDLGLQIDLEEVPLAQKRIIRCCNDLGKPVITATQMLESMLHAPRPTRAEAGDVANAILDGTDAVMLSGETAMGEFPIEACSTMARIAREAEKHFNHESCMSRFGKRKEADVASTEAIAHSVVSLADLTKPAAIVTTTTSGQTARLVSKFRPRAPILCATSRARTHTQMSVVWGVEAALTEIPESTDENVAQAIGAFVHHRRIKVGDTVLVTAGMPAGTPGNTNLILNQVVK
ncbi:MAG: pyruvate kinase [Armatimonadetes bacterium]|nr:pyruvate kinase [Armatimonadota bacterium]